MNKNKTGGRENVKCGIFFDGDFCHSEGNNVGLCMCAYTLHMQQGVEETGHSDIDVNNN